ncbi:MAG: radical SAM protein [Actinomycetia bacterium]|nr:radical SAM protein [Actinomycetes bacterium]
MKNRYGPFGIHGFDRESGIHVLIDEVSVPENRWHRASETLSIAVHNYCDLSCSFCFAPKEAASLTSGDILKWIELFSENGCFCVGFGGGEPTIYPDFTNLCKEARESTDLAITFTTHGHHLTEDYCGELLGNVDFVRVSMDGIEETYELLRGMAFSALIRNIRNLRGKIRFGIATVVNSRTLPELDDVLWTCKHEHAEELLLLPEYQNGLVHLNEEERKRLEIWIMDNYQNFPIRISDTSASQFDVPLLELPSWGPEKDYSTFEFVHIDASGRIKASSFDDGGVSIYDFPNALEALEHYRNCEPKKEVLDENLESIC